METTDNGILGTWQHPLEMVMANAMDLPHLEAPRIKLECREARRVWPAAVPRPQRKVRTPIPTPGDSAATKV